jgi:hypothetical protein
MYKEALKKALLEAGRILLLAIIPVAIPMLESWTFDWKTLVIVGGIALLRAIDKYLHEVGIEKEASGVKSALTTGLTRF